MTIILSLNWLRHLWSHAKHSLVYGRHGHGKTVVQSVWIIFCLPKVLEALSYRSRGDSSYLLDGSLLFVPFIKVLEVSISVI